MKLWSVLGCLQQPGQLHHDTKNSFTYRDLQKRMPTLPKHLTVVRAGTDRNSIKSPAVSNKPEIFIKSLKTTCEILVHQ